MVPVFVEFGDNGKDNYIIIQVNVNHNCGKCLMLLPNLGGYRVFPKEAKLQLRCDGWLGANKSSECKERVAQTGRQACLQRSCNGQGQGNSKDWRRPAWMTG